MNGFSEPGEPGCVCCGKGIRRAGEEEAGRSPQGILRKGRKLQCSGSEELDQDLVHFRPVSLPRSLWLSFTHHDPSARCAGFQKGASSPSLGFSSHPAETSMRLVGGIICPAAWPECHSLGKPDFLERTSARPAGKSKAHSGEAQWKLPSLQESWIRVAWGWRINENTDHGNSVCHHDLTSYYVLGTAISPLRGRSHLIPTTALKGVHDFKKDPLLYLIWHSSLDGIAMAKCEITVLITKKRV